MYYQLMLSSELKIKLGKSLDFFVAELKQLRTGRASPSLFEDIKVSAYGSQMTIKELGNILTLDSQTLAVIPWDKGLVSAIVSAIRESQMGFNPIEDSDRVRIPIPPLTEERRIEFTKMVSTKHEDCKNSFRSIRQEAIKELEKDFADKKMGEDEKFRQKEEIEKVVKEFTEKADEQSEAKKQELMTV